MIKEKKVEVKNKTGLHARPASQFVQKAGKFSSKINVICEEKEINAKSIMGLLSLGISQGKEITIKAEGEDADNAIDSLSEFIEVELLNEDE
jgi:phosphocarrier protein